MRSPHPEMLTLAEHQVADLLEQAASLFAKKVVGEGPTRDADTAEFFSRIHDLQHAVMAQAAARAFPSLYRLAGQTIGEEEELVKAPPPPTKNPDIFPPGLP